MIRYLFLTFFFAVFLARSQSVPDQKNPKVKAILESLDGESYSEVLRGFILAQKFGEEFIPIEKKLVEAKLYSLLDDKREPPEDILKHDVRYSPVGVTAACVLARYSEWPETILPNAPEDFERFRSWYEEVNGIVKPSADQMEEKEKVQESDSSGETEDIGGHKNESSISDRGGSAGGDVGSDVGVRTGLVLGVGGIFSILILISWVMKK